MKLYPWEGQLDRSASLFLRLYPGPLATVPNHPTGLVSDVSQNGHLMDHDGLNP
jgi:hypothetical protein